MTFSSAGTSPTAEAIRAMATPTTVSAADGDGDRHPEPAPVEPGRAGGDRGGGGDDQGDGPLIVLESRLADAEDEGGEGGQQHSAGEGEQQDDAGQRHAPLAGEEFGEAPGGRRRRTGRRRATGRRTSICGADRLADPADREQQDRRGDADEDVVEAGDAAGNAPRRPAAPPLRLAT